MKQHLDPAEGLFRLSADLGRGLISSEPEASGRQRDRGKEVARELFEARGDAPEVLELVEVAFDEVSLAVDAAADRTLNEPAPRRWNVGLCAARADEIEQGVGVVAAVGDHVAAFQPGEQLRSGIEIVGLSGRQNEAHRQAVLINEGIDLGAQSATRTADGVILAPFFPPAACW